MGTNGIAGRQTVAHDERSEGSIVTLSKIPGNKSALDVKTVSHAYVLGADAVDSYDATTFKITAASHAAKKGDIIRMTSGSAQYLEFNVFDVDTNTITLGNDPATDPGAADTFDILRPLTPTVSSTGGLSFTNTFILDGSPQEVTEDTGTPANNRPLPVKLVGAGGDVNINATNLNLEVQLSHTGAAPDSTQIGDGTEIMLVNASGEAQVADDTARTALAAIQTAVQLIDDAIAGTEMQVDVVSSALPTGAATEAKQDTGNTALAAIQTAVETIDNAISGNEMQVDIVGALPAGSNTIGAVDVNHLDIVDFIDTTPILDTSSTNIPASASTPLTIVASLAAAVKKVQLIDTTGAFIGLYSDPAGSPVLEAIFGPGSDSTVEVSIPAATVLGLRNMENSTVSSGIVAINFMG